MNDYERVKKWREKNRARYNLYQRNRRRDLKSGVPVERFESVAGSTPAAPPKSKIDELRELVKVEQKKPAVEVFAPVPARFGTYRDDGGRPITEAAWRRLQELKERAKGKYEIDDYSQA